MAIGDKALARGMRLTPGTALAKDIDDEINRALDYIAEYTSAILSVAQGGTGATSPAGARQSLDVPSKREAVANGSAAANAITLGWNGATFRLTMRVDNTGVGEIANVTDINNLVASIRDTDRRLGVTNTSVAGKRNYDDGHFPGNVSASQFVVRDAFAANSGYVVAYVNGDGRLSKGASSERYKKHISAIDPDGLGDIFPELHRFQMRSHDGSPSDNSWRYGYIAERLAEHPDQERFVVYADVDGQPLPESIDFIGLLVAQVAQLHQRDAERAAEIADLREQITALTKEASA